MRRRHSLSINMVLLCVLATWSSVAQAAPLVELELVTDKGFPITGAHEWSRALGRLDLGGVRIRSMRHGDRPQITNRGTQQSPSYHVLGVLGARNRLRLPSRSYGLGDMTQLKKDLTNLKRAEDAKSEAQKIVFGLTAEELQQVRQALQAAVNFKTKDQPPAEVVRRISRNATLKVHVDAQATAKLAQAEPVYDNVEKLSTGTALAAVLRPYGLMLQPRKQPNGRIELWITAAKKNSAAWPIGWLPEKKETELMPVLLEFLNAEIDNFTLTETLDALQPRVKTPFMLDHNSLARHGVNPEKVTIVIPPKRTYYKNLLKKVLFQARMKSEVRVDEAGQPLLWITTLKR